MNEIERSEALTASLRHFGWTPNDRVPGRLEIWEAKSGNQVLIPLNSDAADFERLLQRAEQVLLSEHGSSVTEIQNLLRERAKSALDSTHWKRESAVEAGLITWLDGEAMYTAAKKMLVASAKAVREKRMYYGNASSYIAKRFLEMTLMGQTEIGSFVITAHTPANARIHVSQASESAASVKISKTQTVPGRSVLETMQEAVQAVRSAVDDSKPDDDSAPFVSLVSEGVSYELLDALASLTQNVESAISFDRFSSMPTNPAEISFDPPHSEIIARAARRFAVGTDAPQPAVLLGDVTLLSHPLDEPFHVIRLDMGDRKVRVRMNVEQHAEALRAYGDGTLFQVKGTITKEGNQYWMYDASDVAVVDKPDAEDMIEDPQLDI